MKTTEEPSPTTSRLAYTRREAAKVIGVSPITIDRLAKRGLLKPFRATRIIPFGKSRDFAGDIWKDRPVNPRL